MAEEDTDERPNALLTKKDREWLAADEPLYTGASAAQQRYRRRSSIRERVTASLGDLSLLFRELEESEREKIAEQLELRDEERAMDGPVPAPVVITDTIAFLYLLHDSDEQFEDSVRRALRAVAQQRVQPESAGDALFPKPEVDIALTEWSREDIQALKKKVDEGGIEALNREEEHFLLERVADDVLTEALDAQINPPGANSPADYP